MPAPACTCSRPSWITAVRMAIALVGTLSVMVEMAASDELENDIGLRLAANAGALADRMDEGLYERLIEVSQRDVRLLDMARLEALARRVLRD